jgi:hypothetical protein
MPQPRLLHRRSPGERAFDLCALPFFACFLLLTVGVPILIGYVNWHRFSVDDSAAMPIEPSWYYWLRMGFGLLLVAHWVWAFGSVLQSWSDPVARYLRFCSAVLLAGQFYVLSALVSIPWPRLASALSSP